MRTLRRLLFACLISLVTMSCLWDRDTLRQEMDGQEDLVKIMAGWFNRYPPIYYEDRLNRVLLSC